MLTDRFEQGICNICLVLDEFVSNIDLLNVCVFPEWVFREEVSRAM